jgi:GNAT superfamily N-acetyltransferase
VQRRSWSDLGDSASLALLDGIDLEAMAEAWHSAITRPPQARFRVLVAVADGRVVGLATTLPSQDPDADTAVDGAIEELAVDPTARRRGHGSRLVNACVDTLRADGFVRVRHWLRSDDDIRRAFLTEAGWAPDGAHREIGADDDSVRVKQIRMHAAIA